MTFEEAEKKHRPIIIKIIQNKHIDGYEFDDLYQESLMVLDKCMKEYDESKGASFQTYLYASVKNHITNLLRKSLRDKVPRIFYVDDSEIEAGEYFGASAAVNDIYLDILNEIHKMPRGDITYMSFIIGMTNKEIADMLKISQSRVQFLNNRNLKKLRELFKEQL